MAQPNVAREPSMEEILASIRRIIESNDPVGEHEAGGRLAQPAYDDEDETFEIVEDELDGPYLSQVPANDPGRPFASDVMALRPGIEPAQSAAREPAPSRESVSMPRFAEGPMPAASEPQERTLSLADVAARVRAAAGRVPEPVAQRQPQPAAPAERAPQASAPSMEPPLQPDASRLAPSAAPVRSHDPMLAEARSASEMTGDAAFGAREMRSDADARLEGDRRDETQTDARVELRQDTDRQERDQDYGRAAAEPVRETESAREMVAPVTAMSLPAKIEEAALLLSAEAGEQVARSFKELADVFNGIERQSLDDMAREMLQPMLREWLDDNLPTLVERLVREEIDRVARGPRR